MVTHAGTEFEVVTLKEGGYAVQVTEPGELPRMITGFHTQQEAETWMFEESERHETEPKLPPYL